MTSKKDMTRKRTGAEPMRADRPAITRAAILLALGATLGLGAQANAQVIMFENPVHGESGHYHWAPPDSIFTHWLDITLPASAQPAGDIGVPTSFRQENVSGVSSIVVNTGAGMQLGGIHPAFVWGSDFGDPIPAEAPLPPDYSWGDGSVFVHHPSFGSNFIEGENAYIGTRFDVGGGWQYGWIGVTRNGIGLEAFAWGYEQTPGVSIAAGVPAPASVALLGLSGLVAARRRR